MSQLTLIDTDIGDDVDDAFGLALATRLPELQICGVTTVSGPVERRAELTRVLLDAAGCQSVPVAAGSSRMSDGQPGSAKFSHESVIAGIPLTSKEARSQESGVRRNRRLSKAEPQPYTMGTTPAVDLILECSHLAEPLTIITLGPLTNIAAALRADPRLAERARLVAMAGKLGLPYPDWNLRCDPAAARFVLESGLPVTMVGMHVTMRCQLHAAQVSRLFASANPLAQLLARCVLAWRTWQRRMPILHDALAVAVAADPSLVRLEPRYVRVGWAGFSSANRRDPLNALVCTALDVRRFQALINTRLLG